MRGALLCLVGAAAAAAALGNSSGGAAFRWTKPPLLESGVVAFIHVPKTGGTSLIAALAAWAEANGLAIFHDHRTCDPRRPAACRRGPRLHGLPTRSWPAARPPRPPVVFASHGTTPAAALSRGPPGADDPVAIAAAYGRTPVFLLLVRDPLARVISLFRQLPAGTDAAAWVERHAPKLEGRLWRALAVPLPPGDRPSDRDRAAVDARLGSALVLRTERFEQSARLLDAVVGAASRGPTFASLLERRYRCAGQPGPPGARCDGALARKAPPPFDAAVLARLAPILAPDTSSPPSRRASPSSGSRKGSYRGKRQAKGRAGLVGLFMRVTSLEGKGRASARYAPGAQSGLESESDASQNWRICAASGTATASPSSPRRTSV